MHSTQTGADGARKRSSSPVSQTTVIVSPAQSIVQISLGARKKATGTPFLLVSESSVVCIKTRLLFTVITYLPTVCLWAHVEHVIFLKVGLLISSFCVPNVEEALQNESCSSLMTSPEMSLACDSLTCDSNCEITQQRAHKNATHCVSTYHDMFALTHVQP